MLQHEPEVQAQLADIAKWAFLLVLASHADGQILGHVQVQWRANSSQDAWSASMTTKLRLDPADLARLISGCDELARQSSSSSDNDA